MTTILSVIGILVIGSANSSYQRPQTLGLILGLILMVIVSLIDYNWLLNFYWLEYFVGIALLLAVEVVGQSAGGATRWLNLGFSAVSALRRRKDYPDFVLCKAVSKI